MEAKGAKESRKRKPSWLKKRLPRGDGVLKTERLLDRLELNTVCNGARCPNRNECYQGGTATFLILGRDCTRSCRFCSIPGRRPAPPDPGEPERLARAAARMELGYVVITSVTRDDLPDGGASHFAAAVAAVKKRLPGAGIELLVPDFAGDLEALDAVLASGPSVLNHNVETVPSLYAAVRPGADYARSLALLAHAASKGSIPVKSGVMVGLGEEEEELLSVFRDLRRAGVALLTIGQYLKPSPECLDVRRFVPPGRFAALEKEALAMGFAGVASGPFVRSSFRAEELASKAGTSWKKRS